MYEAIIAVKIYPEIKNTVILSLASYSFGFLLWNIDNVFCSDIRFDVCFSSYSATAVL